MKIHASVRVAVVAVMATILACSIGSKDSSELAWGTIGATAGGSLTSNDGVLTIEIPPGALSEDTEISIRAVSQEDLPVELAELAQVEGGYLLEPDGLTFSEPVAIRWEIDIEALAVEGEIGYQAQALVNWSEQTGLEPLDDLVTELSLEDDTAILRGSLDHFSYVLKEDGALTVALIEVDYEHLVGNSFSTTLEISMGVGMHGVLLTEIGGSTIASGQVELASSGNFEVDFSIGNNDMGDIVNLFYRCKSQPGLGTYGATVHALATWEAGPSSADRVLQVTVTSEVNCRTLGAEPLLTVDTGISDFLIEMGFSADIVNSIENDRRDDDKADWLYSIAELPPGLRQEYLDLLWFEGLITNAEYEQVREWFNDSLFPCGELIDERLTVCGSTAGDFPAGDMLVFAAGFDGIIPLEDPEHHYVYAVVLDGDGDPANNFQFMPPYDWDYYQGTDQWYELIWDPTLGSWELDLTLPGFMDSHTDARAVIAEDLVVFFIPASEVDVEMPMFRMTSFGHDGTYAPEASGGDVSGANPTEPLMPLILRLD